MAGKKVEPADGIAQTVIDNEVDESAKSVTLYSPWGTKVTVAEESADALKAGGFSSSKPKG